MKSRRTLRDERGSALSTGAVLLVTVFTLILGIAVDLSGQVQTRRQAKDVAAQAARIAGQQLDADRFLDSGGRIRLSSSAARKAAQDYIEHAGMTGTVTIDGTEITVTATAQYNPVILPIVGIKTLPVTATADARAVRALDGTER
ncbi:MAG: pilus assembly protein [Propionibacteriaceae bacterium]|nr:pilus assembly protein [Propionibacteriaceae bacterium]